MLLHSSEWIGYSRRNRSVWCTIVWLLLLNRLLSRLLVNWLLLRLLVDLLLLLHLIGHLHLWLGNRLRLLLILRLWLNVRLLLLYRSLSPWITLRRRNWCSKNGRLNWHLRLWWLVRLLRYLSFILFRRELIGGTEAYRMSRLRDLLLTSKPNRVRVLCCGGSLLIR